MRCPNCNKEMSDFIDVYKCCYCDLQIEKTITEQQKIDELNQKWLEAIKDWKKIIAEKDQELALYKKAFEIAKLDGLEMQGYLKEAKEEIENEQKY